MTKKLLAVLPLPHKGHRGFHLCIYSVTHDVDDKGKDFQYPTAAVTIIRHPWHQHVIEIVGSK